jgi:hypothetical protein
LASQISRGQFADNIDLMVTLCQLFRTDLSFASHGAAHSPAAAPKSDARPYPQGLYDGSFPVETQEDGFPGFLCSLGEMLVQPTPPALRREVAELLCLILNTGLSLSYRNPEDVALKRSIVHAW